MDRAEEFRQAAAECVGLANATTDSGTRVSLLMMAQKWLDIANDALAADKKLEVVLQDFNDHQMTGR
jgi:hypothetical protein